MDMPTNKAAREDGFTLMELLIVVAIIAVLVAVAIPLFTKEIEKSREAYDIQTMRTAASAAAALYYDGVRDQASSSKAGLAWWGSAGAANANAWGVYDPASSQFVNAKSKVSPYGQGTTVDAETSFTMGNDRGAYGSDLDYTDGIVMIAIYPYASQPHLDVYWKNGTKNDSYIGGAAGSSDPYYSIRLYL